MNRKPWTVFTMGGGSVPDSDSETDGVGSHVRPESELLYGSTVTVGTPGPVY